MEVLKATESQWSSLNGYSKSTSKLEFVKFNDEWIIGTAVLLDDDFIEIRTELEQLQIIEYSFNI